MIPFSRKSFLLALFMMRIQCCCVHRLILKYTRIRTDPLLELKKRNTCASMTTLKHSTEYNTIEDRWKRSPVHQKHVHTSNKQQQCEFMGKSVHFKKKVVSDKDVCFPQTFPLSLSYYNEMIMVNLEGYPRIKVGGHNKDNHRIR